MTKEEFIELIERYGEAEEAFGDYMSQSNGQLCCDIFKQIKEVIDQIWEERK